MPLYSIIFMRYVILFSAYHVCIWPSFVRFCYAEVALPELLEGHVIMALVLVLLGVLVALSRLILYSQRMDCHSFAVLEKVSAVGCHYVAKLGSCHFHLTRRSFIVDGSLPSRYYYWLSCSLFLAGDIALNPGPAHFPCTVCAHPVSVNHRGIQCDGCAFVR